MKFASRLGAIKPSATLAINAKALELKSRGIDIISLALGEPDFPTPKHICEAGKRAIDLGKTKYTAVDGIPEAKAGVCRYYKIEYNEEVFKENVIITNGGKQALYNLLLVLCSPGDEVLIPTPYWTSYPEMVALADGVPVYVETEARNGFRFTIADLEKKRTAKTRVLILNSPSNPSGKTFTQEEIESFALWAIEHDIFVISDEIYDQLVYSPWEKASLVHLFKKYPESIGICNGVAKSFAMTGWRLGYIVGDSKVIKQASTIQSQATSSVCSMAQYAMAEALNGDYKCIKPMKAAFEKRRDMAYAEISSWPQVVCHKPEGAFYLFPDFEEYLKAKGVTGDQLCELILEKANVAVVPGSAFGMPSCIRLSYALADTDLMEALKAIRKILF